MADIFVSHLKWTGAADGPTHDPKTFSRDLEVTVAGRPLPMSSPAGFRGDPSRLNPEQLFVASVSACQALTFLFLAAKNDIGIADYHDTAEGNLGVVDGVTRMARVVLRPCILLESAADEPRARQLVAKAHANCFIANSVWTTVEVLPVFEFANIPAMVG